jgi:hypothetical protein
VKLSIAPREIAPRLSAGAYILHSGLEKRNADEAHAKALHGMAAAAYPALGQGDPVRFVRLLSKAEITVGAVLLLPVVPAGVAGAVLTAFSGGLLGMYLRTPGLRRPGSLAPSPDGIAIAKDVWMLGIGLGLLADAAERRRRS